MPQLADWLEKLGMSEIVAAKGAQVGLRRQVGEIVFFLSRRTVFADEPSLLAGEMLLPLVPDPLR